MFCVVDGDLFVLAQRACAYAPRVHVSISPFLHLRFALGFMLATLIVSNALFVHSPPALLFVYAGPVLPYTTCTNNYAR